MRIPVLKWNFWNSLKTLCHPFCNWLYVSKLMYQTWYILCDILYYNVHLIHTLFSHTLEICGDYQKWYLLCDTLYYMILHYITLYYIILHYITLYIWYIRYTHVHTVAYVVHMYHIWCIPYTDAHTHDEISLFVCTCMYMYTW